MSTLLETSRRDPYAEVRDVALAAVLTREDAAEETGLNPLERITCRIHRRWLHHCVHSRTHVIPVTGHRWCRACECAADISVDELTGTVAVRCTRCRRIPEGPATRQLIRCCRASLAAAQDSHV
ncbi:hypothetical protein ACFXGA_09905 [Actinosynnema sp. NPDC059335]|uniref:hypothetical protein n=1 Tax=Actinosynnema sp. NPDC059335 TaxID=3346804 RepID=UPI00366FC12C